MTLNFFHGAFDNQMSGIRTRVLIDHFATTLKPFTNETLLVNGSTERRLIMFNLLHFFNLKTLANKK